MTRYEVEMSENRWVVVDSITGSTLPNTSGERCTRLEAQALADFRNGIGTSTQKRINTRLQSIRLAWEAVFGWRR